VCGFFSLTGRGDLEREDRPTLHFLVEDGPDAEFLLPDAIKLGMGDFIFYSVLVGRAAMYDMLTVRWTSITACV
jgi:Presenilin